MVTDAYGARSRDRPLLGSGAEFQMSCVAAANAELHAADPALGRARDRTARRTGVAPRAGRSVGCAACFRKSPSASKSLADYTHIAGRGLIERIRELAEPLQGKRVLHVSATAFGGGVSEILYTLVPLMRDVGLDAHWQVILGREEFFNVTKLMHNSLQGDPRDDLRRSSGRCSRATTR